MNTQKAFETAIQRYEQVIKNGAKDSTQRFKQRVAKENMHLTATFFMKREKLFTDDVATIVINKKRLGETADYQTQYPAYAEDKKEIGSRLKKQIEYLNFLNK